jgi:L-threonylcarbamoyladenylate synthase
MNRTMNREVNRASAALDEALARIARGGLVAYPTETLFGLGVDATRTDAVERLRAWKGRRDDQPLSLLVEDAASLASLGVDVPPAAERLARELWPGPLTLVLPCARGFAAGVARSDGAVGVRCSPHPVAAELARRLAERGLGPITATSLNRSGAAPAADRSAAAGLCGEADDEPWLLDVPGTPEPAGCATTVVDATGARPHVLREGAVPDSQVYACLGARAVDRLATEDA